MSKLFEILSTELVLGKISEDLESKLYKYFKGKSFDSDIEDKLLEANPELFVKLVRITRSFLKYDRICHYRENLRKKQLSEFLTLHINTWLWMYEKERNLWEKFDNEYNKYKQTITNIYKKEDCFMAAFADVVYWLSSVPNKGVIEFWVKIVDIMVNKLLADFDADDFVPERFVNYYKCIDCVPQVIGALYDWAMFTDQYLDFYCFNMNVYPSHFDNKVFISQDPESYYRYAYNGQRLKINNICYLDNRKFEEKTDHILDHLKDLGFQKQTRFTYNGIPLIVEDLYKFSKYLCRESVINNNPYMIMDEQKLIDDFGRASVSRMMYDYTKKTIGDINGCKFETLWNVIQKPLLKCGKYIVCLSCLEKDKNLFYSLVNNILSISDLKENKLRGQASIETSKLMEKNLLDTINEKLPVDDVRKPRNKNKGDDVDIMISDAKTILLIQVKRTEYKSSLYSQYNEYIHTDKKAASQLNKWVELNLSNHEERTVYKWIVSNSFERCLEKIDNCTIVNSLDILRILRYNDGECWNSLADFVSYVESDMFNKVFFENLKNKILDYYDRIGSLNEWEVLDYTDMMHIYAEVWVPLKNPLDSYHLPLLASESKIDELDFLSKVDDEDPFYMGKYIEMNRDSELMSVKERIDRYEKIIESKYWFVNCCSLCVSLNL